MTFFIAKESYEKKYLYDADGPIFAVPGNAYNFQIGVDVLTELVAGKSRFGQDHLWYWCEVCHTITNLKAGLQSQTREKARKS